MTRPTRISAERAAADQALLTALLAPTGHGAAARDFVRRFERLVTGCVIKVLRRFGAGLVRDDIDDMVNDAWLALFGDDMRRLHQYDGSRGVSVASFVALVATNAAIDGLRRRSVVTRPLDELDEWQLPAAEEREDALEAAERVRIARVAVSQLSPRDQEFVIQIFQQERAPELVARELGVTTSTVYARKFKLTARLAKLAAQLAA